MVELEAAAGERFITRSGCLDWGEQRDPLALARFPGGGRRRARELLSAAAASERWDIEFDSSVLWQPDAGVIDAERSVNAMVDLASSHGARLVTGRDVRSIERTDSGYRLRDADGGSLDAERVVLCAGGFLPRLLQSAGLDSRFVAAMPSLTVTQEQAFHFPYRDSGNAWPTFINKANDIQSYGLPGGRDAAFRGQKLAEYAAGKPLPSAYDQDRQIDAANRERLISSSRRTCRAPSPSPTPRPPASSPPRRPRTSCSTGPGTSPSSLRAPATARSSSRSSASSAPTSPGARTTSAGRAAMPREFLLGNLFGGPRSTDGGSR